MKTYQEFITEAEEKTKEPKIFDERTSSGVQFIDYQMDVVSSSAARTAFEKVMKSKGFKKVKGNASSNFEASEGFKVKFDLGSRGTYTVNVSSADPYDVKPQAEIKKFADPILKEIIKAFKK